MQVPCRPFPSHHGSCFLINQILGSWCRSSLTKYACGIIDPENITKILPIPTSPGTSNLWKIPSTYDSELRLQFYFVLVGCSFCMHLLLGLHQ
jgi:hypothetical protein